MTVIRQKINLLVSVKKKTVLDCRSFKPNSSRRIGDHVRFGFVVCPLMVDELDRHCQDVLAGVRVAHNHQQDVFVTKTLLDVRGSRSLARLSLPAPWNRRLAHRLRLCRRRTPRWLFGRKLLQTPVLRALFLAVHELGRPRPREGKAEVAPRQLYTMPLPREDAGIVGNMEGLEG
jgi:hypothetical protein